MFAARAALHNAAVGGVPSNAWALLHFDNSLTNAGNGGTWSANITPNYSSTTVKFGTHSLLCNANTRASSNTSLVIPSNFTVECWFYPTSLSQTVAIFGSEAVGGYMPFGFFQVNSAIQLNLGNPSGSGWDLVQGAGTITGSAWNHLAISGNGTTVKAFLNGTQVISASQPAWTASRKMIIGDYGGSYYFNGYIDEYRFDQTCQYTGNFTPPTAAFT